MKRKLYANTKRITTIFCVSIFAVTILMLVLRLTIFSDMVQPAPVRVETTEGNYLTYSFNKRIYFASPTSTGNVAITSDKSNTSYMRLVISDESGTTVLDTGRMEPGKVVNAAPLSSHLEQGVYPCIAQVVAYDLETSDYLDQDVHEVILYIGELPPEADEN